MIYEDVGRIHTQKHSPPRPSSHRRRVLSIGDRGGGSRANGACPVDLRGRSLTGLGAARDAAAIRSRRERSNRRDLIATAHDGPRCAPSSSVRLLVWGIATLGVKNSSALRDGFIARGPYRISRNPQYVGDFFIFSGVIIVANSELVLVSHLLTSLFSSWPRSLRSRGSRLNTPTSTLRIGRDVRGQFRLAVSPRLRISCSYSSSRPVSGWRGSTTRCRSSRRLR